jgi:sugar lactone lactonase YvrE
MSEVRCLLACGQELGEGPVWNPGDGRLWWVDIRAPALHALEPGSARHRHWPMPAPLGSFAFRASGGLLLALGTELVAFDPETGALEPLTRLEDPAAGMRLNDGKCDRQGRFWVGTMRDDTDQPHGTLYRFGGSGPASPIRHRVAIPNSLAFAPDGRTMYFADTLDGRILAFDYDPEAGEPGNERTFAALDCAPGRPDGSTVDAQGYLWNARYGGACVVRLDAQGRVERRVDLPVRQVTACAFGGEDLATLFITTAAQHLSLAARAAEPLAGGLFACRPGARGLPETPFAG